MQLDVQSEHGHSSLALALPSLSVCVFVDTQELGIKNPAMPQTDFLIGSQFS